MRPGSAASRPGERPGTDTGRNWAAPVWSVIVDDNDVSQWFDEYLNAFAACGRSESGTASLLAYYGVDVASRMLLARLSQGYL